MDKFIYYSALIITVLSFVISSLVSFRLDYPYHLKFFSLLLGVTALNEVGAWFLPSVLHQSNNHIWYNIFMAIEFMMYGIYYYLAVSNKKVKNIIKWYLILFPLFWFIFVFLVFGFRIWNSYVAITGGFAVICFSVYYYYQLFTAPDLVKLGSSTEFWIATALIIFYSGNLPYIGTLNFLMKNYYALAQKVILAFQILYILTYCLFTYAFLCRISTTRSSSR